MKIIVFDTETTGLPESRNTSILETDKWPHVVQISWILYDTDACTVINMQDHVITCPIPIPLEASLIHGITDKLVRRKGVSITFALDLFDHDLLNADLVVAHNISFDKRMCMVEAIRLKRKQYFTTNGVRKPEYCTMHQTKDLCALERTSLKGFVYNKYPTLAELHYKLFNCLPKGTHDSMADVLICLRCYVYVNGAVDVIKTNRKLGKSYELYCGT